MLNITSIPSSRVPLIDDRTGLISRAWFLFFQNLYTLLGAGGSDVSLEDFQLGPVGQETVLLESLLDGLLLSTSTSVSTSQLQDPAPPPQIQETSTEFDVSPAISLVGKLGQYQSDVRIVLPAKGDVLTWEDTLKSWVNKAAGFVNPVIPITLTGSPFTYQNATANELSVIVSGSVGVSALEFTRDNTTWYSTGSLSGMFTLSVGDRLRITYTVAPIVTAVPR